MRLPARSIAAAIGVLLSACAGQQASSSSVNSGGGGTLMMDGNGGTGATPSCAEWLATQDGSTLPPPRGPGPGQRASLLDRGGGLVPIGSRYAAVWLSDGYAAASQRHVMVALHGTHGYPEADWNSWHPHLTERGWGFVGLSYYDAERDSHDDDATIVANLEATFGAIPNDCGVSDAKLHLIGFSRGGAMSFSVAYLDQIGPKLLTGAVSNSGAWPPGGTGLPTLRALDSDPTAMAGTHFWLYCGKQDDIQGWFMCDGMHGVDDWLQSHGADVAALYEGDGGHDSFLDSPEVVNAELDWLESL